MEGARCVSSCEEEGGFPRLLVETLQWFNLPGRPEYHGKLFLDGGEEKWLVGVRLIVDRAPDGCWNTAVAYKFVDACHIAARDALRALVALYRALSRESPMKFFPPNDKTAPRWVQRISILPRMMRFEDPSVAYLATYLHALDDEYDKLCFLYRKLEARNRASEALLAKTQQELAQLKSENSFDPRCPGCIDEVRVTRGGRSGHPTQLRQSRLGSFQNSLLEQWKAREKSPVSHLGREDKASMGAFLTLSPLGEGSSSQQPSQNEATSKLKPVQHE